MYYKFSWEGKPYGFLLYGTLWLLLMLSKSESMHFEAKKTPIFSTLISPVVVPKIQKKQFRRKLIYDGNRQYEFIFQIWNKFKGAVNAILPSVYIKYGGE